jgi:hypothetical protein
MKTLMGKGRRGKLLAEAALPLSYCPNQRGRSDSNRQQAIIHNFGPTRITTDKKRTGNYVLYH